jgi:hypothetical protein
MCLKSRQGIEPNEKIIEEYRAKLSVYFRIVPLRD